jgi:hypothetical protein
MYFGKSIQEMYKIYTIDHRKIRLIEGNVKSLRHKSNLKKDYAAVFLSDDPSPPRFFHGVVRQFCRFQNLVTFRAVYFIVSNTN